MKKSKKQIFTTNCGKVKWCVVGRPRYVRGQRAVYTSLSWTNSSVTSANCWSTIYMTGWKVPCWEAIPIKVVLQIECRKRYIVRHYVYDSKMYYCSSFLCLYICKFLYLAVLVFYAPLPPTVCMCTLMDILVTIVLYLLAIFNVRKMFVC